MGSVYDGKGDYERALEYYGKSLAIKLATHGEQHPDTAATYNNMASVSYNRGRIDSALEYYGKSLAIKLATLGEQHPDTATTYNNMAWVCRSEAISPMPPTSWQSPQHAVCYSMLGPAHPNTQSAKESLDRVAGKLSVFF